MAAPMTTRALSPNTEAFPPLQVGSHTSTAPPTHFKESNTILAAPKTTQTTDSPNVALATAQNKIISSPRLSPALLTGAAAMAELKRRKQQQEADEARQTTPNPAVEAMQSLMGGSGAVSKVSDAPAADKLSEPMRKAAEKIHIPEITQGDLQASPVSMTFGTSENVGSTSSMTATAGHTTSPGRYVAEPAEMGTSYSSHNGHLAAPSEDGTKAFSYPGPMPPQPDQNQEGGPSREKPYVCQTCQARFRRLHDLKRHTKLHTGERPHTCDKCGRRFARGDALARHNKGSGGCAGRRSSFGGDDDMGGEGMEGIDYGDNDDDESGLDHSHSDHSRKRAHVETPQDTAREVYRQHSSTYPGPATNRGHASSVSSMGPPQVIHPGSANVTSPRDMGGQSSPAGGYYGQPGQVFGQQSMIESPKPLSPGHPTDHHRLSVGDASGALMRNRSPSLTTQFQQAHFGRGSRGRTPPSQSHGMAVSHAPVLPPLQANQSQNRSALQPSSVSVPSHLQHQQVPHSAAQGSNPGSLSSQGRSSGSSIRDIVGQDAGDIWGYVRSLESRFSRMQDEYELRISRLQEEVISLKGQMSNSASYSSEMNRY
ncbi:transcriptional regulator crz1 [Acrodontium crateriforme]|uniref:Transcriptional regulator crz1 n=1 Tax=Acrodontium crateriforme TaxID=150365 RepID=A0AAQ3MA44_9PEZI|nr:transcriptional regulator crz1 [Acrodontium crateriforme]